MRTKPLPPAFAAGAVALTLAAVPAVMAPSAAAQSADWKQSPRLEIPVPGQCPHTVSPELIPLLEGIELPPVEQLAPSPDDQLAAAALSADHQGEGKVRDAAIRAMSPARATQVRGILELIATDIPAPAEVSADAPIVVLGNGLNEDGSVHPNLASRLAVAHQLAIERPGSPVIASGGQTEWGPVESLAMRDWLIDRGLPAERITTEENSWATLSNAWHTRTLLPAAAELIVVTSDDHLRRAAVDFQLAFGPEVMVAGAPARNQPAVPLDEAALRESAYRDALLWYLAPDELIADRLPPYFGPGITRFWE